MKQVDELIRGEMAAVQSIDAVLSRIKNDMERTELTSIRQDHVRAVDRLKRYAGADFKNETTSSGPWGAFASAFTGGASLFGDKAAVQALRVGEEYGIKEYREALEDDSMNFELKEVIRSELLPNQERHISTIERYIH
ncbi:MAG TPA: DUF2383 domain-containing protein [Bacteriovoracaceae bacterium]|nr:DUF2383 domain-containing protein [Bacteriovoracaceae bacterium]